MFQFPEASVCLCGLKLLTLRLGSGSVVLRRRRTYLLNVFVQLDTFIFILYSYYIYFYISDPRHEPAAVCFVSLYSDARFLCLSHLEMNPGRNQTEPVCFSLLYSVESDCVCVCVCAGQRSNLWPVNIFFFYLNLFRNPENSKIKAATRLESEPNIRTCFHVIWQKHTGCSEVQPAVGGQRSELGASRRTSGWEAACLSEYSVPTGAGTRTRTWRWSLGLFSGSESPAEADLPPGSAPVRFLVLRAENNYFNFNFIFKF